MAWLLLALLSATLLGVYDVCKKVALRQNAVVPVLFLNTAICAVLSAGISLQTAPASLFSYPDALSPAMAWGLVGGKSVIVLSSWLCGYFAMKHLPLTMVGPVNATRPVMVLLGAVLIYGEQLNAWQWAGVTLAIIAFFLLKRTSGQEGISWGNNRWIVLLIMAAILGAASGLYDKYLLSPSGAGLDRFFVQTWFNTGQALLMGLIALLLWWPRRTSDSFHWSPAIVGVSFFLTAADMAYFYALSHPDAMVSIISMVRRTSVLVSFAYGAFILREKNLRSKFLDLLLLLFSLFCLVMGAN